MDDPGVDDSAKYGLLDDEDPEADASPEYGLDEVDPEVDALAEEEEKV